MIMAEDIDTNSVWYKSRIALAIGGMIAASIGFFGVIPALWGESIGVVAVVVIGFTMFF